MPPELLRASSVMLLRRRQEWEVLMVERPAGGVFGGVWAFPGGAVEPADHDVAALGFDAPWRAAALRETAEEVAVYLTDPPLAGRPLEHPDGVVAAVAAAGSRFDPGRLRYVAAWVTPEGVPKRFDARFYLGVVDPEVTAEVVTDELVDLAWATPVAILDRLESSEWSMMFPTIWHIELLASTDDPTGLPPHPRRQLRSLQEPFEIIESGIPGEELV